MKTSGRTIAKMKKQIILMIKFTVRFNNLLKTVFNSMFIFLCPTNCYYQHQLCRARRQGFGRRGHSLIRSVILLSVTQSSLLSIIISLVQFTEPCLRAVAGGFGRRRPTGGDERNATVPSRSLRLRAPTLKLWRKRLKLQRHADGGARSQYVHRSVLLSSKSQPSLPVSAPLIYESRTTNFHYFASEIRLL